MSQNGFDLDYSLYFSHYFLRRNLSLRCVLQSWRLQFHL